MQRGSRFVFIAPRFPWWGWVILAPLAVLGMFLGAVFLLVFVSVGVLGALIYWIRWKWAGTGMGARTRTGQVQRECRNGRKYDYELHVLGENDKDARP